MSGVAKFAHVNSSYFCFATGSCLRFSRYTHMGSKPGMVINVIIGVFTLLSQYVLSKCHELNANGTLLGQPPETGAHSLLEHVFQLSSLC